MTAMVGVHTLIAVGEAVISGMAVAAVVAARPDLVHGARRVVTKRDLVVRDAVAA